VPDREPRSAKCSIVILRFEFGNCRGCNLEEITGATGLNHRVQKGQLDPGTKADAFLARYGSPDKDLFRASHLTAHAKCCAQLTREFGGFGNEVDRAGEQIYGRRRVGALPGANAGAAKPLAAGGSELVRMLVVAFELRQVPVRLLEVIADQLVRPFAAIETFTRQLVQLGALRFWDAPIRDVAYQHMVEAEDVLHGMHETSFDQPH